MELFRGFLFRPAINLGHDKRFFTVAVAQSFAHPNLTSALVVVPAVVQKIDAAIQSLSDDADRQLFIDMTQSKMPAAYTNRRNFLTCAAKCSIDHFSRHLSS